MFLRWTVIEGAQRLKTRQVHHQRSWPVVEGHARRRRMLLQTQLLKTWMVLRAQVEVQGAQRL